MKRTILFISGLLITVFLFSQCTKDKKEAKNIEQIYKEQGVPVRTEKVRLIQFETELHFNSVLSGIEESSAFAKVTDKVEKIHVKVGDYVKKDNVLLTFPTDNPAAKYYQAKVAFENSKTAYQRMENLYKSGGISQQQLDNTKAGYEVAKANWDAARQTVKVMAPISGYVTKVNVQESDNVNPGDNLFTISRLDKMKAKVWISEKEINDVKKGLPASAIWNDVKVAGKVIQVDMAMDQDVQAFQAVLEFDNSENILKCGTTVDIKIKTYANQSSIVVERKNIQKYEDQFYVYVVDNGKAKIRDVKLGRQQGLNVEILNGLNPGDELIVEGQMLLVDGNKVKIIAK